MTINGHVDVYNRCLARGQLHRAEQLLALAVEPDHQRGGPRRLPGLGQLLGGVAGRADAPGRRRRRQPQPDGLLHRRPAVRQRRLHGRLPDRDRHQRVAAAVPGPRQRDRRLVATACGTRCSPASRAHRRSPSPNPPVHDAGRPTRSAARSRTSTSTTTGTWQVFVPAPRTDSAGTTWAERAHAGAVDPAVRASSSPRPTLRWRKVDSALARGRNLLLHPGRLRRRPDHRRQARAHRRAGPRPPDA